jgi:riboflavin kinase/FMN adenylyltransferase
MRVFRSAGEAGSACPGASVAIGNFDGVHRGHRAVLGLAIERARALATAAGVVLFDPHPREFFQPATPLFKLTPLPQKLDLLAACGLDLAVVLPFDATVAALASDAFAADILVRQLRVRHVVIGHDFHFGRGRSGSPATMQALGRTHGFGVDVVEPVGGVEIYSSSTVRRLLGDGEVDRAAEMLGRWWRIAGTVIGGAGRGTGLGFPTANIELAPGTDLGHGIYAARVHHAGGRFAAAAYLGTRPSFDNGKPVLEVFLLEFDGDLYGKSIEVEFLAFLRPDRSFASLDALKAQMAEDCRAAASVVARIDRDDPYA